MLKLTYTETGLHLELLLLPLEDWLATRVVLSVRAAHPLVVEPSSAALLLPTNLVGLEDLWIAADSEGAIALFRCDAEFLEVTLNGSWVSSHPSREEGVFIATLTPKTEALLHQLWQASQLTHLYNHPFA